MADAIVSEVVGQITSLLEEQARYHINLVRGAEKEVRKLAKDLEMVRNVLGDAENQRFKDKSVHQWLVRLEQTSYEMDDVLDEWNYAILKFQMEQDRSDDAVVVAPKKKVCSFIPSSSCLCFKKASLRHDIAKKIIDVKEKLDEVLKDKVRFNLAISEPSSDPLSGSWRDQSTSFANLEVVYGRDSDRDILVTTRNRNVAEIMGTMDDNIHQLGKLTDEGCWRLLCDEAFSGRNKERFEAFTDISEGIAKKCKGLPLAAKVLGSLLRSKSSLEAWEDVLNSEIWQLEKAELELFPHLLLSYNELSPMYKRCFSYCAVFPKDSEIFVEQLIGKWMALGYLGSNTSDMELKGRECFDILATRSLFQDFQRDDSDKEIRSCKMHDIVHDFAQSLWKSGRMDAAGLSKTSCGACDPLINPSMISIVNEFRSFDFTDYDGVPQNLCICIQRLRVFELPKFPKGMENLIHLRWLRIRRTELSYEDLKIIFKLYNLQTLSLRGCELKEIPSEIRSLIHLRDLDFSHNDHLEMLPESMSSLKELLSLNVQYCESLISLPERMHRLKHLHNLLTEKLKQLPQGLGQQIGLHTLGQLQVGGNGFSKLGLLKNLNLLTGSLYLKITLTDDYVEDVINDAREAELKKKIHLHEFSIGFYDESKNEKVSPSLWLGIMEALQPHPNLKCLRIYWYGGHELPIAAPPFIQLRSISFIGGMYVSLPALGRLVCLEDIVVRGMAALQFVGREFLGITTTTTNGGESAAAASTTTPIVAFPKLKTLTFQDCSNWEKWEDITAEEEESAYVVFMPCLTTLDIRFCRKLKELPLRLLSKMSSLKILDLRNSRMLQQWCSEEEGQSLQKFII